MKKQPPYPFKIGFLLSGSGSTLENLLEHIEKKKVEANVAVVISSKEACYGIERANNWGITREKVNYKDFKNRVEEYSDQITEILNRYHVDLVVLGGFLSLYLIPDQYKNRVINIHPALIPSFCGKGYYGRKVHESVIEYGVKYTGCTVHFVDNEYDSGPIIDQAIVRVEESDSAESVENKVQQLEKEIYPRVIQAIVDSRVGIDGRKVFIKDQ